jgi:uncharacterized protein YebE (UPF0316 family)
LVPFIVKVVFTTEFYQYSNGLFWNFAMLFRAVSWSMGYILIAEIQNVLKTAIGFNAVSLP